MQANSSSRTKAICFGYIQTAIQTQRVREDDILPYGLDCLCEKTVSVLSLEKEAKEMNQ